MSGLLGSGVGLSFDGTSEDKTGHFFQDEIGYTKGISDSSTDSTKTGSSDTSSSSNQTANSVSQQSGSEVGSTSQESKNTTQYGKVTQSGIDQKGLTYLLQQILGGNQGLSNLLQGEKGAGAYDSATTALLANDLMARAAGEVQSRNTTVKESGQDTTSGSSTGTSQNETNSIANAFSNIANIANSLTNTQEDDSTDTHNTALTSHDNVTKGNQEQVTNTAESKGGSVVCTHMLMKKKISSRLFYLAAQKHKESVITMRGYHFWAIPLVQRMRRNDAIGNMIESFMRHLVIGRANWLLGKKNPAGFIVQYILRPINWIVGICVPTQDFTVLYTETRNG